MHSARSMPTLREVTNPDLKERYARPVIIGEPRHSNGPPSARAGCGITRVPSLGRQSSSHSPQVDRRHKDDPIRCADFAAEVCAMFFERERTMQRDSNYMATQPEVTEKMRTILVDWLVDVHIKFKLHPESFYLAVDLVDRYLALTRVGRTQLQLVGITAMLLAAKYEEIWAPDVKDCIHISANTYTRDELLRMERAICAALQFKLTVPTCYPFLCRLLETTEADTTTCHLANFFLEHAMLDYKSLQFSPSQLANAAMYLAQVTLRNPDPWNFTLQHYSRAKLDSFFPAAQRLRDFCATVVTSKYQAIRRKYTTPKFSEVALLDLPADLPSDL